MVYDIVVGRDERDKELYGTKGAVFLGRSYVTMGQTVSLSNNILLDVNRPHRILVCGKTGSGKCLIGDTLITLEDGSVIPISELEKVDKKVFGLNEELKLVSLKKEGFYKREVKEILKIRLRSGKEVKLTPEHPLLTIKGWKPVKELNVGSRIATPRKIESFGKERMDPNKVKLLAYLIAEGHIKGSWVLFSNQSRRILNEFKRGVYSFHKDLKVVRHSKPACYRVARNNNRWGEGKKNPIKCWLKDLGLYDKLSKEKFIPKEIFKLDKELIRLFLNRLFSCDGSIYCQNGWEIDYSSSSKILINQVHHLLLRFGILSRVRIKKVKFNGKIFDSYELVIGSTNVDKFIGEIGFYHPEKISKSIQCLSDNKKILRNPNVDTIPKELWDLYRPQVSWADMGRWVGYKYPKSMRSWLFRSPSRQTLLQIGVMDSNRAIQLLAASDIFWDEVVSIEKLEGEFEVYDISVPEHHNFVANDIIVHNSYSLSVMAEEISRLPEEVKTNVAVLFFDTMGVFWTMKFPNERQSDLLERWKLKPEPINVEIYVPKGFFNEYQERQIPVDHSFTIRTSELDAEDWANIFNVKLTEPIGILIERVIGDLKEHAKDFSIQDIVNSIRNDSRFEKDVKDAAENRFLAADKWGLFEERGTKVEDLVKGSKVSVLDISVYSASLQALVIGIISRKLLEERIVARKGEELEDIERHGKFIVEEKELEQPMVWIMVDEAHIFLPKDGKTAASDALISLLRQGRQPGISLILATQQPGEIQKDVLTQSDIVISHRLTAKVDIEALNSMMQTYLLADIQAFLNALPDRPGSCIILDDNSERIYPMQVHPKRSWHGGEAPSAIKLKRKLELGF